ncbi:type II toxin-antitoxin system HicB family antitoxin [Dubosiella muris]|uniref:Type II toxin-antitoxin system HicB family antitoxin n=1 Tax=Dubosiella muris TaxID=3038133 RepID=A0AC61R530_9FIRM|nr:type II toxin-antitoxin system HicB family antitoxin [Dubosiella muris]TGY65038.1 type II toxin-antitoxin system HicB family antitoxin [Dubosiella muris]
MATYPVVVTKEGRMFVVLFPDFNGMSAFGETFEKALDKGADALKATLRLLKRDGEKFPRASDAKRLDLVKILRERSLNPAQETRITAISVDVDS